MKKTRKILIVILTLIILTTVYFVLDRYLFNPNIKGISIIDLKDILSFIIAPLLFALLILQLLINNRKKIIQNDLHDKQVL